MNLRGQATSKKQVRNKGCNLQAFYTLFDAVNSNSCRIDKNEGTVCIQDCFYHINRKVNLNSTCMKNGDGIDVQSKLWIGNE